MKAIHFNEAKHQYTRNGAIYLSATSLIHKYEQPFDSDYWSLYKSIKKVFEKYGAWTRYKWSCGGWESVVPHFRKHRHDFADEVYYEQKELLKEWQKIGQDARDKGTKVHKDLEDEVNNATHVVDGEGDTLIPTTTALTDPLINAATNEVLTEVIVYNDEFKLAGMVDRVDKKGLTLNIKDHKTSKEITRVPFRDETLKFPVDHLPAANYYTYSLQLSLYAWMLAQFGYTVGKLSIDHRDREDGLLIQSYPVFYLEDEIVEILKHYKQNK